MIDFNASFLRLQHFHFARFGQRFMHFEMATKEGRATIKISQLAGFLQLFENVKKR
jgi:hypothetical protein